MTAVRTGFIREGQRGSLEKQQLVKNKEEHA
jgi:hypothetical protein